MSDDGVKDVRWLEDKEDGKVRVRSASELAKRTERAGTASHVAVVPRSPSPVATGVVSAVKDQGGCGGCRAFSAIETLESHLAVTIGSSLKLSALQVNEEAGTLARGRKSPPEMPPESLRAAKAASSKALQGSLW